MKDIQNREDIDLVMRSFYNEVRQDAELGFLFDTIAKVHWETHIPIIVDFWEHNVLGTGNYTRNAMAPHFALHAKSPLQAKHFSAWLHYFNSTVDVLFAGANADLMKERAKQIAAVMEFKILSTDKKSLI